MIRIEKNISILHKKVKNNLTGIYDLISNNTFKNNNIEFKILKRKKVSKNKSLEYLALFEDKKFKSYISSLYPVPSKSNKEYKFDYESINYKLIVDLNKRVVMIEQI